MSQKLPAILGFYYLIFQGYPNIYAKCWIDGSDEWTFIPKTEILEYTQRDGADPKLYMEMSQCFNDMSIYLWDVEEGSIKRLTPSFEKEELKNKLLEKLGELNKKDVKDTQEIGWQSKAEVNESGNLVFKFK